MRLEKERKTNSATDLTRPTTSESCVSQRSPKGDITRGTSDQHEAAATVDSGRGTGRTGDKPTKGTQNYPDTGTQ